MKIAYIMCIYDGDDTAAFARAIGSIRDQNIPSDWELRIYLYVDGPINNKLKIEVSRLETVIYKIVFGEVNAGLCVGLNTLIDNLEDEEFILRMDADDVCLPDRTKNQIQFMLSRTDVDVLGAQIVELDLSGLDYASSMQHFYTPASSRYPITNEEIRASFWYRSPFAHPTVCFRSKIFTDGVRYQDSKWNEDIWTWIKLADNESLNFENLENVVLLFNKDSDFWKRRGKRKALDELNAYLSVIERRHHGALLKKSVAYARYFVRRSPVGIQRAAYYFRNTVFFWIKR